MKKIFVTTLALTMGLSTISATEATPANTSVSNSVNFDYKMRIAPVSRALELNQEQQEEMSFACEQLNLDITRVKYTAADKQQERLDEAVMNNLAVARTFLTSEQYRQYLRIINEGFNASGLTHVLNGTQSTK